MLIGIDASRYIVKQKTGVERYSSTIINELSKIANKQKEHTLVLYTKESFSKYPTKWKDYETRVFLCVMPFKRLWTQVRLSFEMVFRPPDVLFVPSHVLPIFHPKKSVVMIHDVAFKYFGKAYSFWQYFYLNWSTKFAVKHAKILIVPSRATKKDLVKFYNCPSSKIRVIMHGVTNKFKSAGQKLKVNTEENDILRKFWIKEGDKFMLFIGRLEAKKNLARVVEAFKIFSEKFPDFKLILAGNRGIGFRKIWKKVCDLGLKQKVLMPGYINEKEKDALLKNALIFVFPSLYEGFGFPVLEAFLYKVPVLTSNCSSLPEVALGAALLVNPKKASEIAKGMKKLAEDKNLRENLIKKGLKRVKKFSWEKSAEDTWKILID